MDHHVCKANGKLGPWTPLVISVLGLFALSPLGMAQSSTSTSISSSANPSVYGQSVTFTAQVESNGTAVTEGDVTFKNDGSIISGCDAVALDSSGKAECITDSLSVGSHKIKATYNGTSNFASSSDTLTQEVNKADTSTTITSDSPDPSVSGESYTVKYDVTVDSPGSGTPTGDVQVSDGAGASCTGTVADGQCDLTSTKEGDLTLTADYQGDGNFNGSSDTEPHKVQADTATTVACSETELVVNDTAQCTVTVKDATPDPDRPTGNVSLAVSPPGEGNLSKSSCTLNDVAECSFTYTPTEGTTSPHDVTASYQGDADHSSSSDDFAQAIVKREVDVRLSCSSTDIVIKQTISCGVTLVDDTTEGTSNTPPSGTVTFDDAGQSGGFNNTSNCDPASSGSCKVSYTPAAGDKGRTTITATFTGSAVHKTGDASQQIIVALRPTSVAIRCENSNGDKGLLYVRNTGSCTIEVVDDGPTDSTMPPQDTADIRVENSSSTPSGNVKIDGQTRTTFSCQLSIESSKRTKCSISYERLALPNLDAAKDAIVAEFPADEVHASSAGAFAQAVSRRPTQTKISCPNSGKDRICTVTVSDDTRGTVSRSPSGKIVDLSQDSSGGLQNRQDICLGGLSPAGGGTSTCNIEVTVDAIRDNVTVAYSPSDPVFLKSTNGTTLKTGDQNLPKSSDGAFNIAEISTSLNDACLAAGIAANALDTIKLAVDASPDITVSFFGGTTIPVSDIAAAVIDAAKIVLDRFNLTACTDLDGDGIQGVIEAARWGVPSNPVSFSNPDQSADVDGDGMPEGDELAFAGGLFGGDPRACPDIVDTDSDNDNLQDGYEQVPFQTDFCTDDTDNDGVSDSNELGTRVDPQSTTGFQPDTKSEFGGSLYSGPQGPLPTIDQANPLAQDTDGDGLIDEAEFAKGCNGGEDGFANKNDSDDDGVIDGPEPTKDVRSASQNNGELDDDGETAICDEDSDGDGLKDGAETQGGVALRAGPATPPVTGNLIQLNQSFSCLDSADWDTDDDGLSDEEEARKFNTDPCDPDTDADKAEGQINDRNNTSFAISSGNVDCLSDCEEALGGLSAQPFGDVRDQTNPRVKDTDGDSITDKIEFKPGCGGIEDGFANSADSDEDGARDGVTFENQPDVAKASGNDDELFDGEQGESLLGNRTSLSNLCDADSDGDGTLDGAELSQGTDAGDWDTDDDGLSETEEVQRFQINPNDIDTDDDKAGNTKGGGLFTTRFTTSTGTTTRNSGAQQLAGYPSSSPDSIECRSDCEEGLSTLATPPFADQRDQTNPRIQDTDGDNLGDVDEFKPGCVGGANGFANSADSDNDGARDAVPFEGNADVAPSNGNDGELNDGEAREPLLTNNTALTSITKLPNLCDSDADGDGIEDGKEQRQGTNPENWDTEDDGLSDREEGKTYGTDPKVGDTDDDTADGVIPNRAENAQPVLTTFDDQTTTTHSGSGAIACLSDCEEAFSRFSTQGGFTGEKNDQADPLQVDTDGDELNDDIEFQPGCDAGNDDPQDGFVNSFNSDDDGVRDGGDTDPDNTAPTVPDPGEVRTVVQNGTGNLEEQNNDPLNGICDPDSDGDGLLDGEEADLDTERNDWDTDDDGRNDGHETTGSGPTPTDPFDPDTDDDGLLDSAEVFGPNATNPTDADTDGDGLCDGGGPGFTPAGTGTDALCTRGTSGGSVGGIGDHPNPDGLGEDANGNGGRDAGETDPNQHDTDGDADGDGVEKLGFSTSRQSQIPNTDSEGRDTRVQYPATGCLDPLKPDTDSDGLSDGREDANHDGNFDFVPTDFDWAVDPLGGSQGSLPRETNPCDPDTDRDSNPGSSNRVGQAGGNSSDAEERQRRTNPLDFDSDNDLIDDGVEVAFVCERPTLRGVDNDGDGDVDEDAADGIDNDEDGSIDEDPAKFTGRFVANLGPLNRDSDADGTIDGLENSNGNARFEPNNEETNPCATPAIPVVDPKPVQPEDTDDDGFADQDERAAGTDPNDPEDHPTEFADADLDDDGESDDRLWLEDPDNDSIAETVAIDVNDDLLVDARVGIVEARNLEKADLDDDGSTDDCRYTVRYAFANQRAQQPRFTLTIQDVDCDGTIETIDLRTP